MDLSLDPDYRATEEEQRLRENLGEVSVKKTTMVVVGEFQGNDHGERAPQVRTNVLLQILAFLVFAPDYLCFAPNTCLPQFRPLFCIRKFCYSTPFELLISVIFALVFLVLDKDCLTHWKTFFFPWHGILAKNGFTSSQPKYSSQGKVSNIRQSYQILLSILNIIINAISMNGLRPMLFCFFAFLLFCFFAFLLFCFFAFLLFNIMMLFSVNHIS